VIVAVTDQAVAGNIDNSMPSTRAWQHAFVRLRMMVFMIMQSPIVVMNVVPRHLQAFEHPNYSIKQAVHYVYSLVVCSGHEHYLDERYGFDIIVKKYCQFCHAEAVFY
jgi:hypothetical protein